jgi:hypothetical protein
MRLELCVGLFGTCGGSTWRDPFMERYAREGITFFNPQVPDWRPELAEIEAEHLASDRVILSPVLSGTYGCGSLAESGFSIAQAMRMEDRREFVLLIEKTLDDALDNEAARKESLRARSLTLAHMRRIMLPNVHLVESLDEMLELSIKLYRASEILASVSATSLRYRNTHM